MHLPHNFHSSSPRNALTVLLFFFSNASKQSAKSNKHHRFEIYISRTGTEHARSYSDIPYCSKLRHSLPSDVWHLSPDSKCLTSCQLYAFGNPPSRIAEYSPGDALLVLSLALFLGATAERCYYAFPVAVGQRIQCG